MKYILSIVVIIVAMLIFESNNSKKKAERFKKEITCKEFLKTNSKECLESPFSYVNMKAKEKALKEINKFKKDIIALNNELNNFFNAGKINENEYQIVSWSEFDSVNFLVKDIRKEEIEIYKKKIVALSKLSGCLTPGTLSGKKKYYICSDNINTDDEFRTTIYIQNIEKLPNLKKIFNKLSKLGLRSESLFRANIDYYDLQVYGKLKKIDIINHEMEVHSIKFFQRLISDKQILNLLEQRIFWKEWSKVKNFQKSKSL